MLFNCRVAVCPHTHGAQEEAACCRAAIGGAFVQAGRMTAVMTIYRCSGIANAALAQQRVPDKDLQTWHALTHSDAILMMLRPDGLRSEAEHVSTDLTSAGILSQGQPGSLRVSQALLSNPTIYCHYHDCCSKLCVQL